MENTKEFEDEDFSFIGWFGEDSEELEDYEEGNYEEDSGRRKTDPDDEDWAYKYDSD